MHKVIRFLIFLERIEPFELIYKERFDNYNKHPDVINDIDSVERQILFKKLDETAFIYLAMKLETFNNKNYNDFIQCLKKTCFLMKIVPEFNNCKEFFEKYCASYANSQYGLSALSSNEFDVLLNCVDEFVSAIILSHGQASLPCGKCDYEHI